MTSTSILTSSPLFTQVPQVSTYPNIQCLISAQTPLAAILNGQSKLAEFIGILQKNNAGQRDPTIKFNQIASQYQFNLFKQMVPKLIFSRYTSRQFPGMNNSQSTITNSDFASEVMFKIDFDSSVVSDMIALITLNIGIDTSALVDETLITIQGYSSKNTKGATTVKWSDVLSLQFSYCEDFLYHWISSVDIGFCNTGGSNPIWHQRVPIEIAWIYHRIILPQEMGTTIKRLTRDDAFTIGHDPFHTYGNFMYQMKASNDLNNYYDTYGPKQSGYNRIISQRGATTQEGMNEIAMYYVQNTIKGVGMSKIDRSSEANPTNWVIGRNPQTSDIGVYDQESGKGATLKKFDMVSQIENAFFGDLSNGFSVAWGDSTDNYQSCPVMYVASTQNIPFSKIVSWVDKARYSLPTHQYTNCMMYLVPIARMQISNNLNFAVGFACVTENTQGGYSCDAEIKVSGKLLSGAYSKDTYVKIKINDTSKDHNATYQNIKLVGEEEEDDVDDNGQPIKTKQDIPITGTISNWPTAQVARGRYMGCGIVVSAVTCGINNVSIMSQNPINKSYILNENGQLEGIPDINMTATGNDSIISIVEGDLFNFMTDMLGITDQTIKSLLYSTQYTLFKKAGAVSPYINIGSLNYMLVEYNDFDLNDFGWEAMYETYYSNNVDNAVYPPQSADMINDMFRYNMAMLNNKQNEEFCPAIRNPDYVSIHTFRKEHGIVDFYFPLNFLFICQGLNTGFPHYACASQSIMIKFSFNNPKAYINTCLVVKPTAIDLMDTTQQARVYINRINTYSMFTTNYTDMRMVLFYNRYVWVPELADIIANYTKYTWILRNYERIYHTIGGESTGQQILYEFNRSVFYTKIWLFIVNTDTYEKIQAQGGITQTQPLYVNKYHLQSFDVCQFQEATSQYKANSLVGSDLASWNKQYNSPYGMVPVDSFQLITNSTISMQDSMPYRLQQFIDFTTLDHTQCHQPILSNNLVQFNIDPIYYQMDTPNSTYSPAYAPAFQLKYTPKLQSGYNRKYGAIIISECVNISYINNHVMLSKYQTDS